MSKESNNTILNNDNNVNNNESEVVNPDIINNIISDIPDDFKDKVKEYVLIDDQLNDYKDQIKDLNLRKKELYEDILEIMNKKKIMKINISNGVLELSKAKKKSILKEETIKKSISKYLKNNKEAENITTFILEDRDISESNYIKRTRRKKKNIKEKE